MTALAPVRSSGPVLDAAGLMARLRGTGVRPPVDPGLAGGLRDWLDDALVDSVAALGDDVPDVRVTKEAVNQVLACEAHHQARRRSPPELSLALVRGALVDALFRQWVTAGEIGDPMEDGLASLAVQGDRDGAVPFVAALDPAARATLAEELHGHVETIRAQWPVMAPGWMARTQERLLVPVAGGRVVLSGVVDLALGSPSAGTASVCVVEVKSGRRRVEHRGDIHLYALMETLRSGAPPFRVATYYSATGEIDAEPVGQDALAGALHRVLAATIRLCRLAGGDEPARTPNGLCSWCADLPRCAPGRARVADARRDPGDADDADAAEPVPEPEEDESWPSR